MGNAYVKGSEQSIFSYRSKPAFSFISRISSEKHWFMTVFIPVLATSVAFFHMPKSIKATYQSLLMSVVLQ